MGRLHLLVRRHDAEVMGCKSPAGRDERNRCNLSLAVCVKAVVSCEFSRVIFRAPIDRVALFLFCREGVKMRKSFEVKTLSITLLAVILLVTPLLAAEFTEQLTLKADELILVNLIGEVTVEQASGSVFVVDVAVRGEDASRDLIQIESDEDRKATVVVNFPTDKERKYVYPKLGRNAKTTITFHGDDHKNNNWLAKLFNSSHRKIKVSGSGSGLEVWADVTVRVPAGKGCVVKHGVGEIKALDVKGDLDLDIHSGPVAARRIEGSLVADTGSGSVTIEQAEGDLNVDTGSGSVVVNQCEGERVSVDTGSGSVKAEDIACDRLVIDTGSGSVRARAVTAEDAAVRGGIEDEIDLAHLPVERRDLEVTLSEKVVDYQIVGRDDATIRLMTAAAPRENVAGRLRMLQAAGVDPQELAVGAATFDGLGLGKGLLFKLGL